MAVVEALTLALSAAVVAGSAPRLTADRQRLAALALIVACGLALVVERSRPRAPLSPRERLDRADEQENAYEAFYAAKLMAKESAEGRLELARRAEALLLFRTCEETAAAVAREGDPRTGRDAQAIARRCRDAQVGGP